MRTLIPEPTTVRELDGHFTFPSPLPVTGGGQAADYLEERLSRAAGVRVCEGSGGVVFSRDDSLGDEAYRLRVSADGIQIESADDRGAGWAVQTLLQLLPPAIYSSGPMEPSSLVVPCVEIEDAPRYHWRGSHIDVARNFLPLEGLYRHLEVMAMHKLNVLHLHLTDDQGWRIPIEGFPKLIEKGSVRPGTLAGHQPPPDENDCDDVADHDGIECGGYYTRDDITALIERAGKLGIQVVPEIDMPGHMESVVAAYPELGCVPIEHPRTCWGISEHVLALTDEAVEFCRAVLTDVASLFPGSPIHVGGDECPGKEWREHGPSRATMERIGATTPAEAQAWFENEVCTHVLGMNRRVIAWDEVLDGTVPEGTTVMVWRKSEAVEAAMNAGFDAIAAPTEFTYFDYRQHSGEDHPLTIGGNLPLSKVAGLSGLLDAVGGEGKGELLGAQFQLWTEYVHDWVKAEYLLWPRGCSVAQQVWSGSAGNARELETMKAHLARLTARGLNWCRTAE